MDPHRDLKGLPEYTTENLQSNLHNPTAKEDVFNDAFHDLVMTATVIEFLSDYDVRSGVRQFPA